MFVAVGVHRRVSDELIVERTRREMLERQIVHDHALVEFLCARVNQLEVERATLLKIVTKTEFPIPTLTPPSVAINLPTNPVEAMSGVDTSIFHDMGDEAARRAGVRWNGAGEVEYAGAAGEARS